MGSRICACMLDDDEEFEKSASEVITLSEKSTHTNTAVTRQSTGFLEHPQCGSELKGLTLNVEQDATEKSYDEETMFTISLASPVEPPKEWSTSFKTFLSSMFTYEAF